MSDREIKESPFEQGTEERVAYKVTVPTSWGTSPLTSLSVKLYEDPEGLMTDVSATKLSGSATASGQVITTPLVISLTEGTTYRMEVKFTVSEGDTLECWGTIVGKR